jgi:hypothetical protein
MKERLLICEDNRFFLSFFSSSSNKYYHTPLYIYIFDDDDDDDEDDGDGDDKDDDDDIIIIVRSWKRSPGLPVVRTVHAVSPEPSPSARISSTSHRRHLKNPPPQVGVLHAVNNLKPLYEQEEDGMKVIRTLVLMSPDCSPKAYGHGLRESAHLSSHVRSYSPRCLSAATPIFTLNSLLLIGIQAVCQGCKGC